jgi:hypothetical protein
VGIEHPKRIIYQRRAVKDIIAELVMVCIQLLTPSSLLAFVLGAWRLGAELSLTSTFPINTGFYSHWIVWASIGLNMQLFASLLDVGHNVCRTADVASDTDSTSRKRGKV